MILWMVRGIIGWMDEFMFKETKGVMDEEINKWMIAGMNGGMDGLIEELKDRTCWTDQWIDGYIFVCHS